ESDFLVFRNIRDAVDKIRGPKDTVVHIVIARGGVVMSPLAIRRGAVMVPSVESQIVEGVGYAAIESFGERTGDELEDALLEFKKKHISRVIIDVRDNPGGLVMGVLETLYYFSSNPKDVMMTERFRGQNEKALSICYPERPRSDIFPCSFPFAHSGTYDVKTPGRFEDMKIVVLVNKYSASASEIFAGTLKDWGVNRKGIAIVGKPTYGKGVGQIRTGLVDGFSIVITTFEYFVGNSKTAVNEIGVFPNYIVSDTREGNPENTLTERDAQFRTGLSVLKEMQ
ncbi:MAG: S41 family peptidase, partial [Patescibacteria group bacterium]